MKNLFFKLLIICSSFSIGVIFGAEIIIKLGGEYYLPIRRRIISKSNYLSIDNIKPQKRKCPLGNLAIGYFGQSNSTNKVSKTIEKNFPKNLYQFNWKTGNCLKYSEPLLGTSGIGGNTISFAAIKLATNYPQKNIIIIPFGVGRSSVLDWSYGYLSQYHEFILERIKYFNLEPILFLWHQGESDSRIDLLTKKELLLIPNYKSPSSGEFMFGTKPYAYENALKVVVERTLNEFPKSKFGVALVSRCVYKSPYPLLRNAQKNVAFNHPKVFISADSDLITGKKNRPDGCHFSQEGSKKLGMMYFKSIKKELLD